MMPRPAAFARATKSAWTYLKVDSAIAGIFERNTSTAEPAGEMSSVDTLSPSLITTGASSVSATGSPSGTGLMFGPRGRPDHLLGRGVHTVHARNLERGAA